MASAKTYFLGLISFFVIGIYLPTPSDGQDTSASNNRLLLEKSRQQNLDAQTEYYRRLSKELDKKEKPETFWEKIVDNPTGVLGLFGVFIAAMITLMSFIFNYRATLRNQKDTQFYEALKRFGDKDSPAIRSSAAGILSHMAFQKKYYETVLNQLTSGLMLEENPVVINSIKDALSKIVYYDSENVITLLHKSNLQMQGDMINLLSDYQAIVDHGKFGDSIEIASLMNFDKTVIHDFMKKHETRFSAFYNRALLLITNFEINGDKIRERLILIQEKLRILSYRLSINTSCIEAAIGHTFWIHGKQNIIQKLWWKLTETTWHSGVRVNDAFLIKIDLKYLDYQKSYGYSEVTTYDKLGNPKRRLRGVNISKVLVAYLSGCQLNNANFCNSNIHYWNFSKASLDNAKFYGVYNFSDTSFDGANWWKADFYDPDEYRLNKEKQINDKLLEYLFKKYGEADIIDPHPSVHDFMQSRKEKI